MNKLAERNFRLWVRVQRELDYIEERLSAPNITPKSTLVLSIMRSRLRRMVKDSEEGNIYKMSFVDTEREADKLE